MTMFSAVALAGKNGAPGPVRQVPALTLQATMDLVSLTKLALQDRTVVVEQPPGSGAPNGRQHPTGGGSP